jgi:hypothetical protein
MYVEKLVDDYPLMIHQPFFWLFSINPGGPGGPPFPASSASETLELGSWSRLATGCFVWSPVR